MALTRRFLSALGIEADKVDEIITAHAETVDALKEQRDKYKADSEKLPAVQKELDELKEAAGENGNNPYEAKYNELKEEFDSYKEEQTAKEQAAKKTEAYRAILKEAGVSEKRIDAVLKVSDMEKVELEEGGKIKGKKDLIDSIKEEWADFIVKEDQRGARTERPPKNGGGTAMTKAEIMAIKDGAERRKAIADNPELFGLKLQE